MYSNICRCSSSTLCIRICTIYADALHYILCIIYSLYNILYAMYYNYIDSMYSNMCYVPYMYNGTVFCILCILECNVLRTIYAQAMYSHLHTHTQTQTHTHTYTHTCIHTYIHTYTHIHTYIHT